MAGNSGSFKRILEHIVAQGISQLLYWGGGALITSVLPSIFINIQLWQKVLLTVGLFIILFGIILFIFYRKDVRHREWKRIREEFILAKIPDLIELPKTLWSLHKEIAAKSVSLETRNISEKRISRCNDEYIQRVQSGQVNSLFGFTEPIEIKRGIRLIGKINKKIKHPLDKRLLSTMDIVCDIMDNHKMGLSAYLQIDSTYRSLKDKSDTQKIRADEDSKKLIRKYLAMSFGMNSLVLFFAYCSKIKSLKDSILRQFPGFARPLPRIREDIDEFMQLFLAYIQDMIEKGIELPDKQAGQ